jgi:hypothetical protein
MDIQWAEFVHVVLLRGSLRYSFYQLFGGSLDSGGFLDIQREEFVHVVLLRGSLKYCFYQFFPAIWWLPGFRWISGHSAGRICPCCPSKGIT